jgi:glycosyltransferase involved in cell wall biosynthesis
MKLPTPEPKAEGGAAELRPAPRVAALPSRPRAGADDRAESGLRQGICALVHTFNEEKNLEGCLADLQWCDEILVVDSFSTDRTPEIARACEKVRFVQHPYYGAAAQKNRAMGLVRREWLVIFDADERCTPKLRDEILATVTSRPADDIFVIRRRSFYLGRVLRYSGFKNDRVARLMRTGTGQYENRRVHARVVGPDGRVAIHYAPILSEPMDHLMVTSLAHHLERVRRYAWWGAAQSWRDGRRIGAWGILRRSIWRFLRTYFIQFGFLDGMRGFVFCASQAMGTFMKWAIVWSWGRAERDGMPLDLPVFDEDPAIWRPAPEGKATSEST